MEQEKITPTSEGHQVQNKSAASSEEGISKNILVIAGSIIFAGALIAGAVMYSGKSEGGPIVNNQNQGSVENVSPITEADHIKGNINAAVKIIEFSDTECPYCKQFHETMNTLMAEYGPSGKLAWVYRHFPLTELHPLAPKEAEATECAAELGGNDKFWAYVDHIFKITPANNGLDPAELQKTATRVGLDVNAFNSCLESGRHAAKIARQSEEAVKAGAQGTPYSVLITKKGEKIAIPGALPYASLKELIEKSL